MSSRAWVVDLIRSIGEKTALADHLEEQIVANENVDENEKILHNVLELRREQMSYLLEQAEKPNPKYWCQFKHSVKSFTNDTELYEANPCEKTLEQMRKSADILAMTTSLFLGMEFEVCARCFADRLNVIEHENKAKTQ